MPLTAEQVLKVEEVFFPYTAKKRQEIKTSHSRFVYYTTAAVATNLLTSHQIWMRNTSTMNDYMEVEHGFECLRASYDHKTIGALFKSGLDECFAGISKEIADLFNSWLPDMRSGTYITCVSEHAADEDQNGRLSMWRAYGAQTGVALIFNSDVMLTESDILKIYSSPVAYRSPEQFA